MNIEDWVSGMKGVGDFDFSQFSAQFAMPEAIVLLALGVLVLLFGYRIKKIAFFIVWFLIGFNLTGLLMPMINNAVPDIAGNELYQMLIPIGGGVILALLGFTIERLCVGGAAFFLTMLVTVQYFGTETTTLVVGAIVAAAIAALAVMMIKPATIILTAVAGAYAGTVAALELWPQINAEMLYWPILAGAAIVGVVFQFLTTRRSK